MLIREFTLKLNENKKPGKKTQTESIKVINFGSIQKVVWNKKAVIGKR